MILVPAILIYFRFFKQSSKYSLYCLLALNLLFCAIEDPRSTLLLLLLSGLTYACGQEIPKSSNQKANWLTAIPILLMLANLVAAKWTQLWVPFGLSFYTFPMISYLVDIKRKQLQPATSYPLFLTSVSSFLYITAGPITRPREMMPRFLQLSPVTYEVAKFALVRILWGLTKKNLGDVLGQSVAETFDNSYYSDVFISWMVALNLTAQYYADFSGYTDIAIGLGALLGIKIPENFRLPFLATSVADHWRRWHITLAEWFRDYVFTPLCFFPVPKWMSRHISSQGRLTFGVLVSMSLIGLWHGINVNNLLWGFYNGFFILIGAPLYRLTKSSFLDNKLIKIGATFYILSVGRVLTRAPSLIAAVQMILSMHTPGFVSHRWRWTCVHLLLAILAIVIPHVVDYLMLTKREVILRPRVAFVICILLAFLILVFRSGANDFVYQGI